MLNCLYRLQPTISTKVRRSDNRSSQGVERSFCFIYVFTGGVRTLSLTKRYQRPHVSEVFIAWLQSRFSLSWVSIAWGAAADIELQ